MFIIASCVIGFGLDIEASRKAIIWKNSSLESRVRVDQICRDCESKISWIRLMMDLRVVDISDLDVIFDMDLVDSPSGC